MIASSVAPSTNVAPPTVSGDDASLRIPSEHQEKAAPESAIPWNKGRLIGQKAPFKHQEVWTIRASLQITHKIRDLALFDAGFDSKLRGCDLISLRVADVWQHGKVVSRTTVMQKKTKRPVQFELTAQTRESLSQWIAYAKLTPDRFLFPSHRNASSHLSTRQYSTIVHRWASLIGLDTSQYGTHSMRRTKPTLIYKKTKNLRAVQLLLGHTKLDSTVRYLGVELDDALEISEQIDN